jgi:hypothetical protein
MHGAPEEFRRGNMQRSKTMNMMRKWLEISLRALLLTLIVAAFAIDAARAAHPAGSVQVACGHRYIAQAEASRLFGTNSVSQAYARRRALYLQLARACAGRQGTTMLAILAEPVAATPARER